MTRFLKNNKLGLYSFLILVVAVIVFGRIITVAVLYAKHVSPSPVQDPLEYRNLAINILEGNSFSMAQEPPYLPDLLRTPMYPILLAVTFLFDKSGYLAIFLQQLMLFASFWMLWKMFDRYNGGRHKIIAALFSSVLLVDPRIWFWSLETMTETFFIFLEVSALFILIFAENINWRRVAGSAALLGLAVLTRPSGLLLIPGFVLFFVFYRRDIKKNMFMLLGFAVIVGFIVLPWLWRNYQLVGRVMLSSSRTVNYALGFQDEPSDITVGCYGHISDSKGREVCLFRSFTSDGFYDVEKLADGLGANISIASIFKQNLIGAYHFWTPNDYKDIFSIAHNTFFGAETASSRAWILFVDISYRAYAFFIVIMLALAAFGLVFLHKKKEWAAAGLFGAPIFLSTFINFGIAGGRHHLILLPTLFFLAGLGAIFISRKFFSGVDY